MTIASPDGSRLHGGDRSARTGRADSPCGPMMSIIDQDSESLDRRLPLLRLRQELPRSVRYHLAHIDRESACDGAFLSRASAAQWLLVSEFQVAATRHQALRTRRRHYRVRDCSQCLLSIRTTRHRRLPRPRDGEDRCAGGEEGAADRAAPGEAHRPHHPRRHQGPRPERPHEGLRRRVAGGDPGALGGEAVHASTSSRSHDYCAARRPDEGRIWGDSS